MVKSKPKIVIDNLAKTQLKEAYTYIALASPKSAEKVKAKIPLEFPRYFFLTRNSLTVSLAAKGT
jgi:hypothetical protein